MSIYNISLKYKENKALLLLSNMAQHKKGAAPNLGQPLVEMHHVSNYGAGHTCGYGVVSTNSWTHAGSQGLQRFLSARVNE